MKSFVVFAVLLVGVFAYPSLDAEWDEYSLGGIEKRILGGQIAAPNQFPYQAKLDLHKRVNGKLMVGLCGGSLISNKIIVTAAHCLDGAESGVVNLGITRLNAPEITRVIVKVTKKDFIIHEGWNPKTSSDDIALIILPTTVGFNAGVNKVNLPRLSRMQLENTMGIISGFGKVGNQGGGSNELRFVQRRILTPNYCESAFGRTFRHSTHVCVDGGFGKSACPGDSGGPLIVEEANGSKTLVGLTSFGSMSCEMGYPVAYTRITAYLVWISQKTGIPIYN